MDTGRKPFIYVSLFGRIGNNLFQLATAASLARRYDCKWVAVPDPDYTLPEKGTLYDYLQQFKSNLLRNVCIREGIPLYDKVYNESSDGYEDIPWSANMLLYGYFQSEKYFEKDYVRELFAIDPATRERLTATYGDVLALRPVSLNVRRGDYLVQEAHHPVCTKEYFDMAIGCMGRDRHYLITSDDLDWCKENFVGENFHFARHSNPVDDLYLQTLCADHIISNSSFSWWGAWLDPNPNKRVIAPGLWYGPREVCLNVNDLLPESWEII